MNMEETSSIKKHLTDIIEAIKGMREDGFTKQNLPFIEETIDEIENSTYRALLALKKEDNP